MLWCMAGTTPKARALGAELRKAREDAGLGLRQLAEMLDISHATLSRWETGNRSPRTEDVAAYLAKVDVPSEQRDELIELARDPDGAHWLSVGMPEQHRQLATLLEIERAATRIITVSPLLIPGLLQTGPYARTVITAGAATDVDTRVAVRLGRREAITRTDPVELQAFIGEPVLYQNLGGREVMLEQLRTLVTLAELDNVTIRVLPTEADWHPGLEGPFAIAEFADRGPVVHLENRISGLFLHEPDEVEPYESALDRVEDVAMSPRDSTGLIADVISGKETTT